MHVGHLLLDQPELARRARLLRRCPDTPFPVLSAKIKLTWQCNLRCRMCSLWRASSRRGHTRGELPESTVCKVLEHLADQGLRKVHFSGGEVLLYSGLRAVIDKARQLDVQVNLTTNGTLVDKEFARFAVDRRVHTLVFSLDSHDQREHDRIRGMRGAWDSTWYGIELLQRRRERKGRGPTIAVNTVVTRANADTLASMYDLLTAHGIDSWRLLPIDTDNKRDRPTAPQWQRLAAAWGAWHGLLARAPLDWSSERSAERAAKGKYAGVFYPRHACFAPWFNLFVDADGSVLPCCMGKRDMIPWANVLESDVEGILQAPPRRDALCSFAAGHMFPCCEKCDDFLEENRIITELCGRST